MTPDLSGWRGGRTVQPTAPVELRFVDLFMIVVAALVFVILSLSIRSFGSNRDDSPLEIATSVLPPALSHSRYDLQLAGRGGRQPYGWRLLDGELPRGIRFDELAGLLAGTPVTPGRNSFTLELRDAAGARVTRSLELKVYTSAPGRQIRIDATRISLADAVTHVPYQDRVTIAGGLPPYQFSVDPAALPPGLTFSVTGTVEGTPVLSPTDSRLGEPWQVMVLAKDVGGRTLEAQVSLRLRYQDPPSGWGESLVREVGAIAGAAARWVFVPLLLASLLAVMVVGACGFRGGLSREWKGAFVGLVKGILQRARR